MITIEEFKKKHTNKVRLLGLDLGSKNIGVSICDENQSIATPYKTIIKSTNNDLINNLKEIEWVLGQPIDLLFSNEKEINLLHQSIKTRVDILCSSGAKGCSFNQIKVDAKEISVINTNGAGDALIGIFLSHYNLISQQEALKKAVDYATQVCLIGGPRI